MFGDICEESAAARLPQSPPQRPKSVHAPRGGPRRGRLAPDDVRKPSSKSTRGARKVPEAPGRPPKSSRGTGKGKGEGTRHGGAKPSQKPMVLNDSRNLAKRPAEAPRTSDHAPGTPNASPKRPLSTPRTFPRDPSGVPGSARESPVIDLRCQGAPQQHLGDRRA